MADEMVCPEMTYRFGVVGMDRDASDFVCYPPEVIEPILERCTKK